MVLVVEFGVIVNAVKCFELVDINCREVAARVFFDIV